MITLRTLLAGFLSGTLLLSALFKLARPTEYIRALESYSKLRSLSRARRILLALCVGLAEIVVAILLALPSMLVYGSFAALLLFVGFYTLIARDERTVIANCGCWGMPSTTVPKVIYLVRNGLLVAGAAALAVVGLTASNPFAGHDPATGLYALLLVMMLPFSLLVLELPEIGNVLSLRFKGSD